MPRNSVTSCSSTTAPATAPESSRIDRGVLGLDDPVTKWLPDFRPALADGHRPAITIRQLLTHTAGLSYSFMEGPDGPYHRERVSSGIDQPGLSMDEELARISRAGLAFEPGTQWLYSVSIDVLGAVIAAAARRPLPEAVETLVSKPLGAASFGFTVRDPARLATPYYQTDGRTLRMQDPQVVDWPGAGPITFAPSRNLDAKSFPSGGGGMSATALDFARLLDTIRAGGGALLTRASAAAMLANQIGALQVILGPGWGFGFGGAVLLDPQAAGTPQSRGTWTWSGVYGNSWFVDPALGLTVVALTNVAPEGDSGPFTLQLRDAVYAAPAARGGVRLTSRDTARRRDARNRHAP